MPNTLGKTPHMKGYEIRILEKELKNLSGNKKKLQILEWGSGGSTTHFTRFLDQIGVDYEWMSLEYNKGWYERMLKDVQSNPKINLNLFDVGNNSLRQRNTDMEEYINFPRSLNKKFDFILVDGRKRRRCVLEAKDLLADRGSVFLHDSERSYYRCVFKEFPNSVSVAPCLWRGKNTEVSALRKITNYMQTTFLFFYFKIVVFPMRIVTRAIYRFFKYRVLKYKI